MAPSEHARRWRWRFSLCVAAVLGAAVVVMPAIASSEGGPIEAGGGPPYYEWSPMSVTVNAGGQVTIKDPSGSIEHGVKWNVVPATPSCTGVPGASSGQPSFAKSWSGTCTFSQPGEYTFYCTVHGPSMSGKVIVKPNGETTITSTSTSTPTYPAPPTPAGGGPGYESGTPSTGLGASALLAGSSSTAVKVAANQHGHAVRGSVAVAPAGEGARLEVDLFARSAVVASAGHSTLVRVGRLVVAHAHAGSVRFSVALSRKARNALARRRHLAVTVHVTLQSGSAKPITVTRTVLLRP
jgi:plastocyanin